MTTGPKLPPSLRIPFIHKGRLDAPEFEKQLEVADLSLGQRTEQQELQILECESKDPGFPGSVVITRSRELADLGCLNVSGPGRVDLAMSLVPPLSYIPLGLLHLGARAAPSKQVRMDLLQVLSLAYLAEEGVSYWDSSIETTTSLIRRDSDPELRRQALFVELVGRPAAARRHILEMLETESNAEERRQLEILRDVADRHTHPPQEAALEEMPPEPELRLAIPFVQDVPLDEILVRFKDLSTTVRDEKVDIAGAARLVELAARKQGTRIILLAPEDTTVGCAYFSGTDVINVAIGSGLGLAYFPVDLAWRVARFSRYGDFRADALQALVLSASTRFIPGKGADPELRSFLQSAMTDPDSAIRSTAEHMERFLREESAQPT